ncbi:MAG: pyridoxamine 5'-phosphate oxidase family protein [Rhizomicrobium sp.]
MATIPKKIWPLIDGAFPTHTCLIGTVLADGFAQITPRGSAQVYDGEHISLWERGRGSTAAQMADGTKATVFFFDLSKRDMLPIGGLARLYGTATVHKSGPVYDKVWERLIEPEKNSDPEKKGWAVLIKIDRSEDLLGQPITD